MKSSDEERAARALLDPEQLQEIQKTIEKTGLKILSPVQEYARRLNQEEKGDIDS